MSGLLSGMTGFGRAEGASGDWAWTIEARSVNGRTLEVRAKAPQGLDALDRAARDEAQKRFQRGQVGVTVQLRQAQTTVAVAINQPVLDAYLAAARALQEQGAGPASADGLLALKGVIDAGDPVETGRADAEPAMVRDLTVALDGLKAARLDEGARLTPLIDGFLDRIEQLTTAARGEAEAQTAAIRERFTKRIEDLTEGGAVGRRLDFLTQEFMREANTLCSKAATLALTSAGLDLKAVIEQLREQVQNVE